MPTTHDGPSIPAATIMVVTDDVDAPSLGAALRWSIDLAHDTGAGLILYDRSAETWADSPHPKGPLPADDPAVTGRPHLVDQAAAATARAVPTQVWLATLPTMGSVATVAADLGADVVVLPESTSSKAADRAVPGSGPAQSLRTVEQHSRLGPLTLVEVTDDGRVDVLPAAAAD